MLTALKNATIYSDKYKTHPEAVIVACYYNPENNPYRLKAFNLFYERIKHLNHRIVECVIGNGKYELPKNKYISRTKTTYLLWHKETLLNKLIKELPAKYKYVFWVDADVIFDNKNWLVDSVNRMQNGANVVQPFSHCVHLDKDDFKFENFELKYTKGRNGHPLKSWPSFAFSRTSFGKQSSENYDAVTHGHVGFAWGARREVLDQCPLYEKCLIGGFDHLQSHAIMGEFDHKCINKSFGKDDEMNEWAKSFYWATKGKIDFSKGGLYHIWHGDIQKREYLKRIQDFTPATKNVKKGKDGFYTAPSKEQKYVKEYYTRREDTAHVDNGDFGTSMLVGYATDNALLGGLVGRNFMGGLVGQSLRDSETDRVPTEGYHGHSHPTYSLPEPIDAPNANPIIESENFS